MRAFVLILLVLSGVFANVCEDNKKKIEDAILWNFIESTYNQVKLCKTLHSMYPQMKANECQVAKSAPQSNEFCELLEGAFAVYGIKSNKNRCKYTKEYVKDITNLPNVLRKYVFDVKAGSFAIQDKCVAVSSVKYKYEITDEVVEKIKTALKRLDDDNKMYLRFMEEEDFKNSVLRIYRFVGDRLLNDPYGYYDEYKYLTAQIAEYDNSWKIPIEYEVINWEKLERNSWAKAYTSNYIVKCYKKSPNDSINISKDDITITCGELKSIIGNF